LKKPSSIATNIGELIVQLNRGNQGQAQPLAELVKADLKEILLSGLDESSESMKQAQQTMFAIEEVRALLGEQDMRGALDAARDAGKEWRAAPIAGRE
jgi:hypothetical protein